METAANYIGNFLGLIPLIGATVWVYLDAKAIGDDGGRAPGLVYTKPMAWATGVVLALIVVLPIYLFMRVRYKRLLAERRAQRVSALSPSQVGTAETPGVWPPPPTSPTA